jgi:hypothetical protein
MCLAMSRTSLWSKRTIDRGPIRIADKNPDGDGRSSAGRVAGVQGAAVLAECCRGVGWPLDARSDGLT